MAERTTCLVVGGGPAGLVLGLLLARAGIEVTVLEKHGDFLRDFRGDTVHPSTQDLLDELGADALLRERGIERFRQDIAELIPWTADRVGALTSMDDVKHLDVRLNRLRRWHADGLLCIGDAAHAMSPAGGVGINLAVQDAAAAARLLAGPLLRGTVTPADLAKVRARRLWPTIAVQWLQRLQHRGIAAIIEGQHARPPTALAALLRRVPQLSYVPAYLIGVGLRPEHAPDFARRPDF
jgi:2-polyprenyl-6-methoxyphenol hydroxylase-like FAD-dependent oxidoreductase